MVNVFCRKAIYIYAAFTRNVPFYVCVRGAPVSSVQIFIRIFNREGTKILRFTLPTYVNFRALSLGCILFTSSGVRCLASVPYASNINASRTSTGKTTADRLISLLGIWFTFLYTR